MESRGIKSPIQKYLGSVFLYRAGLIPGSRKGLISSQLPGSQTENDTVLILYQPFVIIQRHENALWKPQVFRGYFFVSFFYSDLRHRRPGVCFPHPSAVWGQFSFHSRYSFCVISPSASCCFRSCHSFRKPSRR